MIGHAQPGHQPPTMNNSPRTFHAAALRVDGHWLPDARITLDEQGRITHLSAEEAAREGDIRTRWLIPAMPNAHCHVFQRAMAGQAEFRLGEHDDFWGWRERMYALAGGISPDELYDLACWTYADMQARGYASVCEFHYLHRSGTDGRNTTAMAEAVLAAAHQVGIGMTFLPVLYRRAGFDTQNLTRQQHRFGLSVQEYLKLMDDLRDRLRPGQRVGVCFHSLRAVNEQDMRQVLANVPGHWPVHIHVAEQVAEVEQCQRFLGQRPVQWLLNHFEVNQRWSLVHATHMNTAETVALAKSGAVAVLCPSTEANLGDGVFPLPEYQAAGGRYGLGSDSNVELNPARECQCLEYGQRLLRQRRVIAGQASDIRPAKSIHAGDSLWHAASRGGWQSSTGQVAAEGAVGQKANWLELDDAHPLLNQAQESHRLDRFVFAAPEAIKRVWLGGECVAVAGEPLEAETYRQQGLAALSSLKRRQLI